MAKLPSYGRPGDACLDLFAVCDLKIDPGEQVVVSTGLGVEIPPGYEMVIRGRGGKTNQGLWAFHGTVDSNFREEIKIIMKNWTGKPIYLEEGKAFVQVAIKPIPTWTPYWVDELTPSNRVGMFGSSDGFQR